MDTSDKSIVYTLQIDSNGIVSGANEHTATSSVPLSDFEVVVSEFIYVQIISGLEDGLLYRYVHGDLVCEGPNPNRFLRETKEKLQKLCDESKKEVLLDNRKNLTVFVEDKDITLMVAAVALDKDFFVKSSEGPILLIPSDVKKVLALLVEKHNTLSLDMKRTFDLLGSAKTSNEISDIAQKAVQRIRRVS